MKTPLRTVAIVALLLPQIGLAQTVALLDATAITEGEENAYTEVRVENVGIQAIAEALPDETSAAGNGLVVFSSVVAQLFGADTPKEVEDAALIIQQKSTSGRLGTWNLITPNGEVKGTEADEIMGVYYAGAGTYNLYIHPPSKADTRVQIYQGTTLLSSGNGLQFAFSLNYTEQLRVIITYSFSGRVKVISNPEGAPFVLTGPEGMKISGTTPAQFGNMPPFRYIADFGSMEGCRAPRRLERELIDTSVLTLNGEYICRTASDAASSSSSTASSDKMTDVHSENIVSHATSTEVVPGGRTTVTISVSNPLEGSIRNLTVSEQFDPAILKNIEQISGNGTVHGNLIIWEIPQIAAGKHWKGSYSAIVDSRQGVQTSVTARVSGQYVENFEKDDLSDTASIGVVVLPQTGENMNILLMTVIACMAAFATVFVRKQNMHV